MEHPLVLQRKAQGSVPINGLNDKSRPEDAACWLDTEGDPYVHTGADIDGRVGTDLGVYGAPEILAKTIILLIERLKQEPLAQNTPAPRTAIPQ